jgi:hypothetical protein
MTTELQQSEGKAPRNISLSDEYLEKLQHLVRTYGITRGEVVEVLLDCSTSPELDARFKTKRLEGKKDGRRKDQKKTEHVTIQTFAMQLDGFSPEQLITIAEAAWKLRGKTENYEDARTPRRKKNPGPGRCSKLEVLEQVRNLSSEQLQTLANQIAGLQTHSVSKPVKTHIVFSDVIPLLTGLLPAQLRTVAETAWKLKGRTEDYESCRTPQRQKRGLVGHREVIEQLGGLSPDHYQALVDLIATFKAEEPKQ